ncbi:MAG: hypothetical protein AUK03_09845 [Anaerolineae bacterium CG2_30_64_16]|nr:MAG: hypothetical protein AUK03_09845 [Anaerolineae bacterium CG2_30_64_16]
MLQATAELIERKAQGASQELRLHAPELARHLSPGQAVLVRAGWDLHPYLRRTFYPIAIAAETWTLRVPPSADWGHAWLRAAPPGTRLDCLGPVGHGYAAPAGVRHLLCVGEGELAWALLPAVVQADAAGLVVTLAAEGRSVRDLIPVKRLPVAVEYRVATLNGRAGHCGDLTPILAELFGWADVAFAAGSLDFYARLATAITTARFGLSAGFAQVLYTAAPLLCGTGACGACAAEIAGGRHRICRRGPVLDLADMVDQTLRVSR